MRWLAGLATLFFLLLGAGAVMRSLRFTDQRWTPGLALLEAVVFLLLALLTVREWVKLGRVR